MTNEELAVAAENHEPNALLMLWEGVSGWIRTRAYRYLRAYDQKIGLELDDLVQEGFLAMCAAVEKFDPGRDVKFLTYLDYFLSKRFAEACGNRYSANGTGIRKSDPLRHAESLNAPIGEGDDDGELMDQCEDREAEYGFLLTEYDDLVRYADKLLNTAMDILPPGWKECLEWEYYGKQPEKPCSRQLKHDRLNKALRRLRRGPFALELMDTLECFKDFEEMETAERYRAAEYRALRK